MTVTDLYEPFSKIENNFKDNRKLSLYLKINYDNNE